MQQQVVFVYARDPEGIHNFNPQAIGAQWDVSNPRIQLEPIGNRGYMELMPIQ